MQKVKLIGNISKFGGSWETDCVNIRDIFKLIECQTPGFRQHLVAAAEAGVGYEIRRGEEFLESEEELFLSLNDEDIIITEVPVGAKAAGKILAAILIVTLVVMNPALFGVLGSGGSLTGLGTFAMSLAVNLAIGGISELLAPGPETDKKQNEGYLFNGPVNTVQQGMPIPVCYGELRIGGAPVGVSFRGMGSTGSGSGVGGGSVNSGTDASLWKMR
jgi:predicted phage tail protein